MKIAHNRKGWYKINPNDQKMNKKMVEYSFYHTRHEQEEKSVDQGGGEDSPDLMAFLRILRSNIRIYKVDNERLVRDRKGKLRYM